MSLRQVESQSVQRGSRIVMGRVEKEFVRRDCQAGWGGFVGVDAAGYEDGWAGREGGGGCGARS